MKTKTVTLSTKALALGLAGVLLIGGTIGGTLAWLVDTTETVTNTFTYGDIDITLQEHTLDADGAFTDTTTDVGLTDLLIVPGNDINKDPYVTVESGSEECWLFVKITEKDWPTFTENGSDVRKAGYTVDASWTQGTGSGTDGNGVPTNVYYIEAVDSSSADIETNILTSKQVFVSEELTKEDVAAMNDTTETTSLIFVAYAVQSDAADTAAEAWALASTNDANPDASVLASTTTGQVAAPSDTEITSTTTD